MPYLTREQILGAEDLPRAEVPVPEWGGVVLVRSLTGRERDQYEESLIRWRASGGQRVKVGADLANARARLVSLAVIDEDGTRLFSDQDVHALGEKSSRALERVFDVAARLSGLQPGDVEELVGNFEPGPSDDSGSS